MTVRIENHQTYLIVHNQHEKRGAISPALYEKITEAMERARVSRIRCIFLTGGPFFCAGGDLNTLQARAQLPLAERREKIERLHDTIRAMHSAPVPLIAAIEGGAAGAGLSIALACDMIVAAEGSKFTAAYVKAGLTPDGGLTHALSKLLPRQMAMEMCLLGRSYGAERLADLGVISRISAQGKALEMAFDLAEPLFRGPDQSQSRISTLIAGANDSTLEDQLDLEADAMAWAQGSQNAAEGISSFLEKRTPDFTS